MATGKKILMIDDDEDFRRRSEHSSSAKVLPLSRRALERTVWIGWLSTSRMSSSWVMMETLEEGYGVTQAVKYQDRYEEYRNIPIVTVSSIPETAFERYPYADEANVIQSDWCATKPLDTPSFLEVVRKAAAEHCERLRKVSWTRRHFGPRVDAGQSLQPRS